MSSSTVVQGLKEVRDACCHCLISLANDPEAPRCEYNFGGGSQRCSRCKALNRGGACVNAPKDAKESADELVAAANEYRDFQKKISLLRMKKDGIFDGKMIDKIDEELLECFQRLPEVSTVYKEKVTAFRITMARIGSLKDMIKKREEELREKNTETESRLPANNPANSTLPEDLFFSAFNEIIQIQDEEDERLYKPFGVVKQLFKDPGFKPSPEKQVEMAKLLRKTNRKIEGRSIWLIQATEFMEKHPQGRNIVAMLWSGPDDSDGSDGDGSDDGKQESLTALEEGKVGEQGDVVMMGT